MDLFMVVYQQGTWFDVTCLPTNLTNVVCCQRLQEAMATPQKSLHGAGWTDLTTVAVKKQKDGDIRDECRYGIV